MKKIMRFGCAFLALIGLSLAATSAHAQESSKITFPGSVWGAMNITPFGSPQLPDQNNLVYQMKAEQGIKVFSFHSFGSTTASIIPFIDVGFVVDSKGQPWNNYIEPGIGVKLRHDVGPGVVDVGIRGFDRSYWGSGAPQSGLGASFFVSFWMGWNPPLRRDRQ